MEPELATEVRLEGLVRSPDREGALAHLDSDRGFALVARASMGFAEVIDPTIWVKEKIALALAVRPDVEEPPLRRLIGAFRAIHAELVGRPQGDRSWVAALAVLVGDGEGAVLIAGDCSCHRFRDGLLARLGKAGPAAQGPPAGALGSETRVRIEVVPLHANPEDLYILCTESLREGELAVLARELAEARGPGELLRRGISGSTDKGWIAFRVTAGPPAMESPGSFDAASRNVEAGGAQAPIGARVEAEPEAGALEIEPLHTELSGGVGTMPAPEPARAEDGASLAAPPAPDEEARPPFAGEEAPEPEAGVDERPEDQRRPRALATLQEERPWYEPFALWGGGALAVVALALLVRSILPGFLGTPGRAKSELPAAAAGPTGRVDIYSEPPGAAIRVDGERLPQRTPAVGLALRAGARRLELDWGAFGSWRDSVSVAAGGTLVLRPRVFGSASFRSSDVARSLDVYIDGAYVGSTPLALDSLAVGKHLVRFGGPGLQTVAQDIEVYSNERVELVGNAGALPETGKLTIRAAILGETGFESSKGNPVWIDAEPRGLTPLTLDLKPGAHSVRVARRDYPPQITVLDIKAGGEQFVTAEFGARSEEPLRFTPPASVSRGNPPPITLTLPDSEGDVTMSLWIHAAAPQGSFQARRMMPLGEHSRTYAALVPIEVLRNTARKIRVYFKASGAAGRELYSEIYTIPVVE